MRRGDTRPGAKTHAKRPRPKGRGRQRDPKTPQHPRPSADRTPVPASAPSAPRHSASTPVRAIRARESPSHSSPPSGPPASENPPAWNTRPCSYNTATGPGPHALVPDGMERLERHPRIDLRQNPPHQLPALVGTSRHEPIRTMAAIGLPPARAIQTAGLHPETVASSSTQPRQSCLGPFASTPRHDDPDLVRPRGPAENRRIHGHHPPGSSGGASPLAIRERPGGQSAPSTSSRNRPSSSCVPAAPVRDGAGISRLSRAQLAALASVGRGTDRCSPSLATPRSTREALGLSDAGTFGFAPKFAGRKARFPRSPLAFDHFASSSVHAASNCGPRRLSGNGRKKAAPPPRSASARGCAPRSSSVCGRGDSRQGCRCLPSPSPPGPGRWSRPPARYALQAPDRGCASPPPCCAPIPPRPASCPHHGPPAPPRPASRPAAAAGVPSPRTPRATAARRCRGRSDPQAAGPESTRARS